MYQSEPEPELNGRSVFTPRGRVLGGSSSINGLVHVRGQREDFDAWARLGNAGWSYGEVLPYFRKSEDQQDGKSEYHGAGGPLPVSALPDRHALCDAFIAAAGEIGIPRNDDFNGEHQEGAGYYHATARSGRRASCAVAYLRPVRKRSNLCIQTGALVTRIRFDGRHAVGVDYQLRGASYTLRAHREVLLCGGSFNSPQLLQLSGLGRRRYSLVTAFRSCCTRQVSVKVSRIISTSALSGSARNRSRSTTRWLQSRVGSRWGCAMSCCVAAP